jgi:hypothetical protein
MDRNSVLIRGVGTDAPDVSPLQAYLGAASSVGRKFYVVAAVGASPLSDDSAVRHRRATQWPAPALSEDQYRENQGEG